MMDKIKNWILGAVNFFLFKISFLDAVDIGVKVASGIAGLVLTVYLIIKAKHDIDKLKIDNKERKLKNELMDQELYERRKKNIAG